jgi:DNA-binding Lrp family transcriptional regulator
MKKRKKKEIKEAATLKKKIKLSFKEKKLLYLLRVDSRTPATKLAKELGCSREMVQYMIKKMVDNKVILEFFTSIDFNKLNYVNYKILIKLKNDSESKIHETAKKMYQIPGIFWARAGLFADYNFTIRIASKNVYEFEEAYSKLKSVLNENLQKMECLQNVYTKFLPHRCTFNKDELEKIDRTKITKSIKPVGSLSKTDFSIINYLFSHGAKVSLSEIAKNLNLSYPLIKKTISKLKESGILSFNVGLNTGALGVHGLSTYYVLVRFVENEQYSKKDFELELGRHPSIAVYTRYTGGNYDYDFSIVIEHVNKAKELITKLVEKFPNVNV